MREEDARQMTTRLEDLQVLLIDCQTTGSQPDKGHLLEIGWAVTSAGRLVSAADVTVDNHLLALPGRTEIPRPVERLTGISVDDLIHASKPAKVWERLAGAARQVAAASRLSTGPAIIHFARFETPFLKWFHRQYGSQTPYPFDVICSHEIARRLLPGLPRKGLRAVAGYFGHSVPANRRSAPHVVATAFIWKHLVGLLHQELNIQTLGELQRWLDITKAAVAKDRLYPMPREFRLALPDTPGIYRMLRSNGDLLYIGKARSLKQRVNTYFQKSARHPEHILEMLSQAADLAVTPAGSALEAAILESGEIKRCRPPYNVALQEQGRRLWFCSRDFRYFSMTPDTRHRIGPLPSKSTCMAVHAIGRALRYSIAHSMDEADLSATVLLDIAAEYAPEDDCLREGLSIFKQRYRDMIRDGNVWRSLMAVGTQSWRKRMEEQEKSAEDNRDQQEEAQSDNGETGDWIWTPEAVAHSLESVMQRCAHLIRRARWLTMLSESSLAWGTPDRGENKKRVLIFRAGAIVDRQVRETADALPVPPGCSSGFRDRLCNLDLITYDRLRVLTTELRRLISENRSVSIRLGSSAILRSGQIQSVLKWV